MLQSEPICPFRLPRSHSSRLCRIPSPQNSYAYEDVEVRADDVLKLLAKLLVLEEEKRKELATDEARLEEVLLEELDVRLELVEVRLDDVEVVEVRLDDVDVLELEDGGTHGEFVHWLLPGPLTITQALLRHSVWLVG